jgi:hypothetical protein
MKSSPSSPVPPADDSSLPRTGRRAVVGAGVAAGAALAAVALARRVAPSESVAKTKTDTARGEGYRLTEHVRRYYETTRS